MLQIQNITLAALLLSGLAVAQSTPAPARNRSILIEKLEAWDKANANALTQGTPENLSEYAAKCDLATGLHVPEFSCQDGVLVPGQDKPFPAFACPAPNVLNGVCDPGSRFQVLAQNEEAAVVAHCRKDKHENKKDTLYEDIAVIQYNKKNGAVCFYQALASRGPDGKTIPINGDTIPAPIDGESAWRWLDPVRTHAIGCTACHDNGGFIRSPYLAQLSNPPHVLPNTSAGFDNNRPILRYVGQAFAADRSWSIEASGSDCNSCHKLAVNNHFQRQENGSRHGTSIEFSLISTAYFQASKLDHGPPGLYTSPMWMRPGQRKFTLEAFGAARMFEYCGESFAESGFSSGPEGCSYTPLGLPFTGLDPAQLSVVLF